MHRLHRGCMQSVVFVVASSVHSLPNLNSLQYLFWLINCCHNHKIIFCWAFKLLLLKNSIFNQEQWSTVRPAKLPGQDQQSSEGSSVLPTGSLPIREGLWVSAAPGGWNFHNWGQAQCLPEWPIPQPGASPGSDWAPGQSARLAARWGLCQCTQSAPCLGELGREDVSVVGFSLALYFPTANLPLRQSAFISYVVKWQISRIRDIFHDFKDISALLPSHILKLMMTVLRVG